MNRTFSALCIFLGALVPVMIFSCNTSAESPNPQHYALHGKIEHVEKKYRILTIHHDEIPGFMEEMTMDFPVASDVNLESLQIGDEIKGDLLVDGLKFKIMSLEALKR